MAKTAQIQVRLDEKLKADAEAVLADIGLSATEYVRMSLRQLVMRQGVPFEARTFNAETIAALNEDVSQLQSYSSVDEMLDDIEAEYASEEMERA
ncbi:MAG: type II toxin-antitoxin system RelB/DinJ family antitoxin [Ahrensia sp.]|nr:type II toxin-antitoxin system RelB/DinJ family antitoxin [Ahrensia sp.]